MAKKYNYQKELKQQMSELIEEVDVSPLHKRFMKSRWLDQVIWMEGRASKARNRHYTLRLITIIGGVIVPALVSVNSANFNGANVRAIKLRDLFGWTAFGLSQAVAISAAIEELFHYGESYRRYRNTVENLKSQGWQFFQLSGPYQDAKTHEEAYPTFANNVETLIQQDVDTFISQAVQADAEAKAATNAAIAQNMMLASAQLGQQLQQPRPPEVSRVESDSTAHSYQPSAAPTGFDDGGSYQPSTAPDGFNDGGSYQPSTAPDGFNDGEEDDDFVSPNHLQPGMMGAPLAGPNGFGGSSGFSDSASFVSNSPATNGHDEDDFIAPNQLQGAPFQAANGGNGMMAPSPAFSGSAAFNPAPSPAQGNSGDDDDFISPQELRGA
jgi:hypothetical protein